MGGINPPHRQEAGYKYDVPTPPGGDPLVCRQNSIVDANSTREVFAHKLVMPLISLHVPGEHALDVPNMPLMYNVSWSKLYLHVLLVLLYGLFLLNDRIFLLFPPTFCCFLDVAFTPRGTE